ncbi:MAG: type 2 isopentenyl-diphosphate Delta-isomerase [Chloroflexi bacterium]|nr:type 2 isopentenyl-diphosphate Delta-isomerase [Chloroflexota bacterium]
MSVLRHIPKVEHRSAARVTGLTTHDGRKSEHLRISLEEQVGFSHLTTGFEGYRFVHQALPQVDWSAIDLSTTFLGRRLAAPLLISPMTGGTAAAEGINRALAQAAQACGAAMGLGSLRAALEDPGLAHTYRVREVAPDILLLANLGAVQLNYGYGLAHCQKALALAEADALVLHLNPLQEVLQPGGNREWAGLLGKIEQVCRGLGAPVVVKEVGWGISREVARELVDAGVAAIDVAGAGGTDWAKVELHRAESDRARRVAATFQDWGIPTAEALLLAQQGAPGLPIIASGGIYDGITAAKALALGAHMVGLARPFLPPALVSAEAVAEAIGELLDTLRTVMFCVGAATVASLQHSPHLRPAA